MPKRDQGLSEKVECAPSAQSCRTYVPHHQYFDESRTQTDRPRRAKSSAPALGSLRKPASKHRRAAQPHAVHLTHTHLRDPEKLVRTYIYREIASYRNWREERQETKSKKKRPTAHEPGRSTEPTKIAEDNEVQSLQTESKIKDKRSPRAGPSGSVHGLKSAKM